MRTNIIPHRNRDIVNYVSFKKDIVINTLQIQGLYITFLRIMLDFNTRVMILVFGLKLWMVSKREYKKKNMNNIISIDLIGSDVRVLCR